MIKAIKDAVTAAISPEMLLLAYRPDRNSFHFIRLLLASLVILSHSYPLLLSGPTGELNFAGECLSEFSHKQMNWGGFAVYSFMVVSGFLVTQSYLNSSSIFSYLLKRCLRIFPALCASLLIIVFLVGPCFSELDLQKYFFSDFRKGPLAFLFYNVTFNLFGYAWEVHDVFSTNPLTNVNASMWTLKHEFGMYLLLPILGFFGLFKSHWPVLFLASIFICLSGYIQLSGQLPMNLPQDSFWLLGEREQQRFFSLGAYFMMGTLLYVLKGKIPITVSLAAVCVISFILASRLGYLNLVSFVAIPYFIIYLAVRLPSGSFGNSGDFSYGIYINAWWIQQALITLFKPSLTPLTLAAIAFLTTLLAGKLSWSYIESPCLKFKYRLYSYWGSNKGVS